jgi:hypothetical protein
MIYEVTIKMAGREPRTQFMNFASVEAADDFARSQQQPWIDPDTGEEVRPVESVSMRRVKNGENP